MISAPFGCLRGCYGTRTDHKTAHCRYFVALGPGEDLLPQGVGLP
jgi:hypothetical protein